MATHDALLAQWENDPEFILEGVIVEITEQICGRMNESKISRAELARLTGKTPTDISAVLSGTQENLTLLTVVELATALGLRLSCRFHRASEDELEDDPAESVGDVLRSIPPGFV